MLVTSLNGLFFFLSQWLSNFRHQAHTQLLLIGWLNLHLLCSFVLISLLISYNRSYFDSLNSVLLSVKFNLFLSLLSPPSASAFTSLLFVLLHLSSSPLPLSFFSSFHLHLLLFTSFILPPRPADVLSFLHFILLPFSYISPPHPIFLSLPLHCPPFSSFPFCCAFCFLFLPLILFLGKCMPLCLTYLL